MLAVIGLVLGIALGLYFDPTVPSWVQPFLPVAVVAGLDALFGAPLGGFEPRGVSSGHMSGSAHYAGRAIDAFVRPVSAGNRRRGWAIAHYLVAQADRLAIRTVIFDDRIWQAGRGGWRDYRVPSSSSGDQSILEHRDHVHVDVAP